MLIIYNISEIVHGMNIFIQSLKYTQLILIRIVSPCGMGENITIDAPIYQF